MAAIGMQGLGPVAERIMRRLLIRDTDSLPKSESRSTVKTCRTCGMEAGAGFVQAENGVRFCRCRKIAQMKRALAVIPPQYRWANLHTIKARPELHPLQPRILAKVKAKPGESYFLQGANGTGKTHFGYALFRHSVVRGNRAVACKVRDLLSEFRRAEFPDRREDGSVEFFRPCVTAEDLRIMNGPKWTLFLEEIDKATATEYAAQCLFDLVDTARSYDHQLIVTTNFTTDELIRHWSRMSRAYGPSIIRRLESCITVELF